MSDCRDLSQSVGLFLLFFRDRERIIISGLGCRSSLLSYFFVAYLLFFFSN
jgi:hypothetical protein